MQSKLWTISALAVELDRDRRTLARDLEGLEPDESEGDARVSRKYRLVRVITHLYSGGTEDLDLNEQKARLAKWQADKTEMEVSARAGELVTVTEVERWYGNHIERCRARLIQLADSIRQFCDPRSADIVVGEIRRIVYEALAELAADRPKLGEADHVEMGTAADPDSEPVGGSEPPTVQRGKRGAGPVAN